MDGGQAEQDIDFSEVFAMEQARKLMPLNPDVNWELMPRTIASAYNNTSFSIQAKDFKVHGAPLPAATYKTLVIATGAPIRREQPLALSRVAAYFITCDASGTGAIACLTDAEGSIIASGSITSSDAPRGRGVPCAHARIRRRVQARLGWFVRGCQNRCL